MGVRDDGCSADQSVGILREKKSKRSTSPMAVHEKKIGVRRTLGKGVRVGMRRSKSSIFGI
ncbi:hypothetical protein Csa_019003 [Cucumis sativus]|uniref:Uncharacterized protein n=1 Tax=Cucumis sativus TaxID=3659 RepID=A0A0A0KFC8_CUCSA|nr:hypothetical protein Csa_019003 [Cucumis sativus]